MIKNKNSNIIEFNLPKRDLKKEYFVSVNKWHIDVAKEWDTSIKSFTGKKDKIALLIWGDPCLYDSSIRIAKKLVKNSEIVVIPGITSIQVLTSSHKINLNEIGKSVLITTGRYLEKKSFSFNQLTTIIMLDGKCSFKYLDGSKFYIWWGAYLGLNKEILCKGLLMDVCEKIIEIRNYQKDKNGWIMDTYLLQNISHKH